MFGTLTYKESNTSVQKIYTARYNQTNEIKLLKMSILYEQLNIAIASPYKGQAV